MELEKFYYDNKIVRNFAFATIIWGFVGMLVGLIAAIQLIWPVFNFDLPYTTFGRIRPLHTNAVIFAFVGNGIFMGLYYSLQRLTKARIGNPSPKNERNRAVRLLLSEVEDLGKCIGALLGVLCRRLGRHRRRAGGDNNYRGQCGECAAGARFRGDHLGGPNRAADKLGRGV